MLTLEVIGGILVAAVLLYTVFAALVGLLGAVGIVRIVRCTRCGRLGLCSRAEPLRSCVQCRHGWLLHPMYSWHAAEFHHTRPVARRER